MFKRQHDSHVNAYLVHCLLEICRTFNLDNINGISDWYACGNELI